MRVKTHSKTSIGVIVALAIVLAACGDDGAATPVDAETEISEGTFDDMSADVSSDATADGTADGSVETTVDEPATVPTTPPPPTTDTPPTTEGAADAPMRVVSLSPIATEMLFAIGAQDVLVAVDDFSYFPEAALELPHDLSAYEPNVEAIAGYEPDLVLIGGDFTGLGGQLESIGIESWDGPAAVTLDDTYAQIEQLGSITGHVGEAAELVARMQADIDVIVAAAPTLDEPLTYYHELGSDLYSVTSSTFIGQIYDLVGLVNIADAADPDGFGYPQLNAEYIVEADPDLIFLADTKCCAQTAETVAARPGWDQIAAVRQGNVIELDDDIASRWGPRVVDFLRVVADAVADVSVST
jgi:iron complex transport system substrate-binding protein